MEYLDINLKNIIQGLYALNYETDKIYKRSKYEQIYSVHSQYH